MESLHKNGKFTFSTQISGEVERTKFKCTVDQCSKIYCSRKVLNQHVKAYHSSTPRVKVKCDLCSNQYTHLKQHIARIHSGSFTKYECTICDSQFKSKASRNYHVVATHTGEKAFPCKLCPAKFSSAIQLRSHQLTHSDEKPHKCFLCSKQFKRKPELRKHFSIAHSQRTRDFECSTCQKTFYSKSNLNDHAKRHSNGGDLACYFCKKVFAQRGHLNQHLRTHTQEKPFYCADKLCKFSCADPSNLRSHNRIHHPSTENQATSFKTCYFCSKPCPLFKDLVTHMRSHTLEEPFSCNFCKKSFKHESRLRNHISTHTKEKPFSCPHCGKDFFRSSHLKSHIATHTGEKRFFCEFCSYSTFRKSDYVKHLAKRH